MYLFNAKNSMFQKQKSSTFGNTKPTLKKPPTQYSVFGPEKIISERIRTDPKQQSTSAFLYFRPAIWI